MTITNNKTRVASSAAALALIVTQLFAPLSLLVPKVAAATTDYVRDGKITICHRTDSYSNPYTKITVDQSAADGIAGNSGNEPDHYGEHQGPIFYPTIPKHTEWGDIIPPITGVHSGLNWTSGQTIWENDCNLPNTGSVMVNKCVDTVGNDTYTCDNELANSLGFQWSFDVQTPSWNDMGTTVGGVAKGDQSVIENQVDGYSLTGWYETGDKDHSCKKPEGKSQPVEISVQKNKTTEVTLCNQADPGTITIVKDAQPNSDQPFGFTFQQQGSETSTPFTLIDDGTTKNTTTFSDLALSTYDVTESATSGWTLNDISCSEGADVNYDKEAGTVSITLHPGDSVMCTYTNVKDRGTLTVYKHTTPAEDPTAFDITATSSTGGTIDGNASRTISDGQSQVYTVDQGTYLVDESNLPTGWAQTSNTCTNVVVSADNLNPTCDIYNTYTAPQTGSITIVKEADPESSQVFEFTSNSEAIGDFNLVDNGPNSHNSQTFDNLNAGSYTITEQEPEDWAVSDISCNTESGWQIDLADASLSVRLSAGQHITCTFENDKSTGNGGEPLPGVISGHKFNDVNGNGKWDQGEPTLKGWQITLTKECLVSGATITNAAACQNTVVGSTTTDANGAYSFSNLPEGKYKVCEVMQPKWTQTFPGTADGCTELIVDGSGDTLTADFGNKPVPQVLGSSTTTVAPHLVNTGASASKSVMVGLAILGALGAVHFLSLRRKDYSL